MPASSSTHLDATNSHPPRVSIVLPTYNRAHLLDRSVGSILAQTFSDWELIIVDDRSTDDTETVVARYSQIHPNIRRVLNTHRQGPAGARNQGIEEAAGELIAFLDSDDAWLPHHLTNCVAALDSNRDVDWVYSDCERLENGQRITESVFRQHWVGRPHIPTEKRGNLHVLSGPNVALAVIRHGAYAGMQTSVMRRSIFTNISMDEDFFYGGVEDRLVPLEAIKHGFCLAYLDEVNVTYHVTADSISANRPDKTVRDKLRVFKELARLNDKIPTVLELTREERKALTKKQAEVYFWLIGYHGHAALGEHQDAMEAFAKGVRLTPTDVRMLKTLVVNWFRIKLRLV